MTSEILYDQSEKIIKLERKNIAFKINKKSNNNEFSLESEKEYKLISKTRIPIINLTDEYISFRVKTTKKKNYTVNPSYYILTPKENKTLNIYYYERDGEETNPKGHKFKFEGFIIPKNENDKNPKDLFSYYEQNKQKIKGNVIKMNVEFIEDNNYKVEFDEKEKEIEKNKYIIKGNLNQEIEELENLKVEYYKLKYIIDNLKTNYHNLKTRLELEQSNINRNFQNMKYREIIEENEERKISKKIFIISFLLAIFVGFYLVK